MYEKYENRCFFIIDLILYFSYIYIYIRRNDIIYYTNVNTMYDVTWCANHIRTHTTFYVVF